MAPQSAQAADTFFEATDGAGDVRILRPNGLSTRARKSIDIRRAWVGEVDNRTYKFSVELRQVARRGARWDQMVFFDARRRKNSYTNFSQVAFTQRSNDGAYAYDAKADEWCDIRRVTRRPAKDILSVKVPLRCMPWGGWKMTVGTITGTFRSDAPAFSKDHKAMGRFYYP